MPTVYRLMESDYREPLNLGSEEMVTVNELARMIADSGSRLVVCVGGVDAKDDR